jgi:hypothetical protein
MIVFTLADSRDIDMPVFGLGTVLPTSILELTRISVQGISDTWSGLR